MKMSFADSIESDPSVAPEAQAPGAMDGKRSETGSGETAARSFVPGAPTINSGRPEPSTLPAASA